jgi:hypothetical protein
MAQEEMNFTEALERFDNVNFNEVFANLLDEAFEDAEESTPGITNLHHTDSKAEISDEEIDNFKYEEFDPEIIKLLGVSKEEFEIAKKEMKNNKNVYLDILNNVGPEIDTNLEDLSLMEQEIAQLSQQFDLNFDDATIKKLSMMANQMDSASNKDKSEPHTPKRLSPEQKPDKNETYTATIEACER